MIDTTTTTTYDEAALLAELDRVQRRSRTRMLDADDVRHHAKEIASALAAAPPLTSIRGPLHDRVPHSYRGIPEGTTVMGEKDEAGNIALNVIRSRHAFGERLYIVDPPRTHKVRGSKVHASTGAANRIDDLTFEPTEAA